MQEYECAYAGTWKVAQAAAVYQALQLHGEHFPNELYPVFRICCGQAERPRLLQSVAAFSLHMSPDCVVG